MRDLYFEILKEELVPALGCTDPIAVAYCSAKAREVLGEFPDTLEVTCSSNIIKNVKGAIVPGTKNMKGIETAAILGAIVGGAERKLEVLSQVEDKDIEMLKMLLFQNICDTFHEEDMGNLYIKVIAKKKDSIAEVIIAEGYTNIVSISKNNQVIFKNSNQSIDSNQQISRDFLTVQGIYDYITSVDTITLKELLDGQIKMNSAIVDAGLDNDFGANVGKVLINNYGKGVENLAKAYAAAGSDARMGGCSLPVVINSGSGNQGLAASIPVITYARYLKVSDEKLYRALALSNLIAIHIKADIGKLSAFCGAVSAACGSGAAIAYLNDESFGVISMTITNVLANTSGIVCDGAKASCAAKIASSVDAAIMGYHMASEGHTFEAGDGLVKENVEETIRSIGRMAKKGMVETDKEILKIMLEN
jgi:L-cysteine desulfidase